MSGQLIKDVAPEIVPGILCPTREIVARRNQQACCDALAGMSLEP
jgi:hypothetical protein